MSAWPQARYVDSTEGWKVHLPEGEHGHVSLRTITVEKGSVAGFRAALEGRGTPPGEYTGLYRNGYLWMSDTSAEQRDHSPAVRQIRSRGGRVLIMGLGLGMVLKQALLVDEVTHVDVVEIDPDVIALVGPHYTSDPRVQIHQADAFEIKWPRGSRWTVIWHDIWPDMCADYLDEMARLARSYARRCDWQGFWGKEAALRQRRQERRFEAMWL